MAFFSSLNFGEDAFYEVLMRRSLFFSPTFDESLTCHSLHIAAHFFDEVEGMSKERQSSFQSRKVQEIEDLVP